MPGNRVAGNIPRRRVIFRIARGAVVDCQHDANVTQVRLPGQPKDGYKVQVYYEV